jgi:hypothetical protein
MSGNATAIRSSSGAHGMLGRIRAVLDSVPYTWLVLPLRFAVATVFWNSAMAKLANWDTTLSLFSDEYQLPLLPRKLPPMRRPRWNSRLRFCWCWACSQDRLPLSCSE